MRDVNLAESHVCIVGATSTIARAVAARLAAAGAVLHLAARNVAEAERIGRDLHIRHRADVSWSAFEATDYRAHASLLDTAATAMGGLDGVVVAVGRLGDQDRSERDPAHLRQTIEVNYTAVVSLLAVTARYLEAQGHGWMVVLSSVAGDRGRPSNYAYGSAKAGLTAFLEGLRGRLHGSGVHVCTVKPGPVDTRMTFGMDDPPPLLADPASVAADVVTAIERRKDVCYTPAVWRYIMTALRMVPASVFKKLDL